MRRSLAVISLALLGAMLAQPAAAQWKWRGANGQIQYSDLPPPSGVADRDILQRPNQNTLRATPAGLPAPAASAPLLVPKNVDAELEAKRKKAEQEQAAKVKAEEQRVAAAKAENCQRAREHIRTLESGMRMARVNDKGEREVIDDTMRAEELKRARDMVNADCAK
ncbi:DUF4124 domain-containing protein [uncultured Piscinibacter sp.]|uniref:DUF4124 domain-containing protein n=1 Tax=uncultured Piscinibacter sp. TaxID=1131835 RepID=UPI0026096761|nr:DUF4124 domain-containing protein [uncultured Piscinibacter sp.]